MVNKRLRKQICYLAGPIENAKDRGVGWREMLTPILKKKFGIGVLNPINKTIVYQYHEDEKFHHLKAKLLKARKYKDFTRLIKKVVRTDLRMVDKSDFLIVYIDTSIHMCGTYHEIVMCAIERKPCLIVCEQGKNKVPPWLWGILDHKYFFSSFESLLSYLDRINSSKTNKNKWLFFDIDKLYA